MSYRIEPLGPATWEAFAELVERNGGIYGGCWCIAFHARCDRQGDHREAKERLVHEDRAHAALVLDEEGRVQGWAQYSSADELDGINHRREYDKAAPPRPDWRIACVYVDRRHRGQGIAHAAVDGALDLLADAGGGLVEVIAETVDGRTAQSRFLLSGTAEMFEDKGFRRVCQVGKHAWVLQREVAAAG